MPAQSLSLEVDTGSSDIWVNSRTSKYCQAGNCLVGGAYDPNSTTKVVLSNDFYCSYGEGDMITVVTGQIVKDSMYFSHRLVPNIQFGLAFDSDTDPGIFGVGYPANLAPPLDGTEREGYLTFAQTLINDRIININAFSMWLDTDDSGTILFGGVDTTRYHDKLTTVPVVRDEETNEYLELKIMLHEISFSRDSIITKLDSSENIFPISVLLDSGSNISILPSGVVDDILKTLERVDIPGLDPMVDCKLAESTMTMDFAFDNTLIRIPIGSFVETWDGDTEPGTSKRLCSVPLIAAYSNVYILGAPFLRSVYVVYNLRDNEISMALARYDASGNDFVEIGSSKAAASESVSSKDPEAVASVRDDSMGTASAADHLSNEEASPSINFKQTEGSQVIPHGSGDPKTSNNGVDTTIAMNGNPLQENDKSTKPNFNMDNVNTESPQSFTIQDDLTFENDFKTNELSSTARDTRRRRRR